MTMLIGLFILAGLFEILLPVFISRWSTRRYQVGWRLFFIGMLTFLCSQILHIPFLQWLTGLFLRGTLPDPPEAFAPYFNAIILGLAAGIFEETARLVAYLLLKKRANSWGAAVTLGAGHGGLESMLVGVAVLGNLALVLIIPRLSPDSTIIPQTLRAAVVAGAGEFWAQPWYIPLLGAFERFGAVLLHILLSVMVWQAVAQRSVWWFFGAVLWHAVVDGLVVVGAHFGLSSVMIEAGFLVITLLNAALLYLLWKRRGRKPEAVLGEVSSL